jgi:hypothetical protein
MIAPITPLQAYEAIKTKGVIEGSIVGLSEFFGFSTKPNFNDPDVMKNIAGSEEAFRKKVGDRLYDASNPGAKSGKRKLTSDLIQAMKEQGLTKEDATAMLADRQKRLGKSTRKVENGKSTSYGRHVKAVEDLFDAGVGSEEEELMRDFGNKLYSGTATDATPKSEEKALLSLDGMTLEQSISALRAAAIRNGDKPISDGGKTAYGKRLNRLREFYKSKK